LSLPFTIEWRTTWLTARDDATSLPPYHPDIDIPDITLEAFLGGGRQGWVYSGRVRSTGALVAVKILSGDYVRNGGAAAREAMNLARIRHPNVPRVFRFQPCGVAWVVIMELVQGEELSPGQLAESKRMRCFGMLADAVCALAEMGLVHRDIKPANIVLRYQDHSPVLVDFGLAVDLTSPLPLPPESWLAGTPVFLAPEAFAGNPPDTCWDAYSLGVTAADIMLEGRYPRAASLSALQAAKISGEFDRGIENALAQLHDSELRDWCKSLVTTNGAGRMTALQNARIWMDRDFEKK
jgi:serine/threonine protein kinase